MERCSKGGDSNGVALFLPVKGGAFPSDPLSAWMFIPDELSNDRIEVNFPRSDVEVICNIRLNRIMHTRYWHHNEVLAGLIAARVPPRMGISLMGIKRGKCHNVRFV